jgi:hypothetical protein
MTAWISVRAEMKFVEPAAWCTDLHTVPSVDDAHAPLLPQSSTFTTPATIRLFAAMSQNFMPLQILAAEQQCACLRNTDIKAPAQNHSMSGRSRGTTSAHHDV